MSTLAERVTLALRLSGLSQTSLAAACGIKKAAVNGWVQGRTQHIRPEHLFPAARALGVSAEWLGTGAGPMLPTTALSPEDRAWLAIRSSLTPDQRRAFQTAILPPSDQDDPAETG